MKVFSSRRAFSYSSFILPPSSFHCGGHGMTLPRGVGVGAGGGADGRVGCASLVRVLRSESESHFLAPDWPTFAQLDAWAHKSLKPLWRTTRRKYNPGVPEILTEAEIVKQRTGWDDVRVPTRVGWLQREMEPMPHFVLYAEQANHG